MPARVSTGDRDAVLRQLRWCAAVRCLTHFGLYAEVDAQCDKLAKVVGGTSTVASTVN